MSETASPPTVSILPWHPDRARDFATINAAWITAMFAMEEADQRVLDDPQGTIIDRGGDILFVATQAHGVIGAGALKPGGNRAVELTKMGVREDVRGLKAGEHLLHALIARAQELGADPLYLLTNHRCAAAIHLYEKAGFVHDAGIMTDYGTSYDRCDVAMRYVGRVAAS